MSLRTLIEQILITSMDRAKVADLKLRLSRRDMILMYHSVETTASGYHFGVDQACFIEQLTYLTCQFAVVSLEEIFEPSKNGRARVALTFDDAYEDFYHNVYPLLLAQQLPATVFVPTYFIEEHKQLLKRDREPYIKSHLTWDQIQEMHQSGWVRFESHSHEHIDAVNHLEQLKVDVNQSIRLIEQYLGRRPKYFAYPYGRRNPTTDEVLRECGFQKLLTIADQPVAGTFTEGRIDIYKRNETMPYFKLTLANLLGASIKEFARAVLYRKQN